MILLCQTHKLLVHRLLSQLVSQTIHPITHSTDSEKHDLLKLSKTKELLNECLVHCSLLIGMRVIKDEH